MMSIGVALVMAPGASAATLTEGASIVAVGSSITAKGWRNVVHSGSTTVTCSSADMTGKVTANSSGTFAGQILAKTRHFRNRHRRRLHKRQSGTGQACNEQQPLPACAKNTNDGISTGCDGAVTYAMALTKCGLACAYEALRWLELSQQQATLRVCIYVHSTPTMR